MRIIGGELRRKKLFSPSEKSPTRPIPDLVKEALFNLLRGHVEGQTVFDGFAGSGSIGLEALSRGAERCVFIERDRDVFAVLNRNIEHLGVESRAEPVKSDALGPGALSRCPRPVHLIFFDPPYALVNDPRTWPRVARQFSRLIQNLDNEGYAMLRTPWPFRHVESTEERDGKLHSRFTTVDLSIEGALGPETHDYGTTAIHLYMKDPEYTHD
ncbi:MAG TPA: 16S rRNA (guanine(966)-N(2))-methyltransferase RsmD [Phycisphaerales bacterium]|nr:16S rRNA (guanine(966)-N(2))-methyltransferase RsmD [Phycisphaerales bacterium]